MAVAYPQQEKTGDFDAEHESAEGIKQNVFNSIAATFILCLLWYLKLKTKL